MLSSAPSSDKPEFKKKTSELASSDSEAIK